MQLSPAIGLPLVPAQRNRWQECAGAYSGSKSLTKRYLLLATLADSALVFACSSYIRAIRR